jgi:predicted nucleotidyltransferase
MEAVRRVPAGRVRLALVFGSWAKGQERADSDVDIAIGPIEDLSLDAELGLAVLLTRALGRDVDLVRLDRASTLLRWEIARHGVVLVEEAHQAARFRAGAAAEHADFAESVAPAARLYIRRLAERL